MSRARLATVAMLTIPFASPLAAQNPPVPSSQKSVRQLIAEYVALGSKPGDRGIVMGPFYRGCPREDARRDSIFEGLLQLKLTPVQVLDFAMKWGGPLGRCNDERLDTWYRDRVRETHDIYLLLNLSYGLLLTHPTPENVAAIKGVIFDPKTPAEARSILLTRYIHESAKLSPRARVDLMAEVYEKSGRLPEPYHTGEVSFLKKSNEVGYWRTKLTDVLVKYPAKQGAFELLSPLASDAIHDTGPQDAAWLARFKDAMSKLANDPRASDELKEFARYTLKTLAEKRK
jgi:hypothetical protein